jgi:hypothetical protein
LLAGAPGLPARQTAQRGIHPSPVSGPPVVGCGVEIHDDSDLGDLIVGRRRVFVRGIGRVDTLLKVMPRRARVW